MPDHPFVLATAAGAQGALTLATELLSADGVRTRWRLTLTAGSDGFHGACALRAPLPESAQPPWFLLPGFFYGQGRTDARLRYPALGPAGTDAWTAPSWDFALERMAYPLALAFDGARWRGFDSQPHYRLEGTPDTRAAWGDSEPQIGLGLGWSAGRGELRLNLPANEAPRRHARNPRDTATAKVLTLAAGGRLVLDIGWWEFAGDRHGYQRVLETVGGELHRTHPPAAVPPAAELADCAAHGLREWHWVPAADGKPGYMVYTAAMDRSVEFNANVNRRTSLGWHFEALGFVGGFPVVFGLLWHAQRRGDARSRAIALEEMDRFCRDGLAPNGLFRTSYHPGRARTPNGSFANGPDEPGYGSCWQGDAAVAHARTTADASFYLARSLALLDRADPRWSGWRAALRRTLEAALRLQQADGRHPQIYDVVADAPRQLEGAGGLLWIPAMHHAEPLFADDAAFQERLRASMRRAGEGYARDVEAEYVCGAPEDVSLAPTSEDGYNAILAYGALHRRFGDARWLDLLRRAADWTLTWRKAYNVRFPAANLLGAGGLRTVGGDFASSNNNHLHVYGMNCLGELHRLGELTGSPYYARRADEHLAFVCQLLCREDGQWNGQRGMMTEQFYTTDWSVWDAWDPGPAHVQKGTMMGFSHVWCVNMILLGLEELERAGRLRW